MRRLWLNMVDISTDTQTDRIKIITVAMIICNFKICEVDCISALD